MSECVVSREQYEILHNYYKSIKDYILGGLPSVEQIKNGNVSAILNNMFKNKVHEVVQRYLSEEDNTEQSLAELVNNYLPTNQNIDDTYLATEDIVIKKILNSSAFQTYTTQMSMLWNDINSNKSITEIIGGVKDEDFAKICESLEGSKEEIEHTDITLYLETLIYD